MRRESNSPYRADTFVIPGAQILTWSPLTLSCKAGTETGLTAPNGKSGKYKDGENVSIEVGGPGGPTIYEVVPPGQNLPIAHQDHYANPPHTRIVFGGPCHVIIDVEKRLVTVFSTGEVRITEGSSTVPFPESELNEPGRLEWAASDSDPVPHGPGRGKRA